MDLGAMALKGYFEFPKTLALLKPHNQIGWEGESYSSAKKQFVYSIAPVNWAISNDWLVSLFNGISTLFRLFNAKAILLEEQ